MSTIDLPPSFTEPEKHRGGGFGIVVSWLIIALSIGVLLYHRHSADEAAVLSASPQRVADFQLRFAARNAVGVKHLLPAQWSRSSPQMLAQLDRAAQTPADKLRAAIVTAEVDGIDAALKKLDAIKLEPRGAEPLARDVQTLRQIYDGEESLGATIDPEARDELLQRHGWFAKLALSWGLPPDSPERRDALTPAMRTAITAIVAAFAVMGMGLAGLVLFILVIVFVCTGMIRRAHVAPQRAAGPFLEAFALYLAWYIGASYLALRFEQTNPALWRALAIAAVCAPLAALWPLVRGVTWHDLRLGLGWHGGGGVLRKMGAGILGYLAGIPIFVLGILITVLISRHTGHMPSHPIVEQISTDPKRVLRLLLLASVYAPLFEETMFRGALYHHLRRWLAWPLAALLVAFLFASIHPQGWAGVPALMGLAFNLAVIREWRGSLIGSITAHALNNTMLVVVLVLTVG